MYTTTINDLDCATRQCTPYLFLCLSVSVFLIAHVLICICVFLLLVLAYVFVWLGVIEPANDTAATALEAIVALESSSSFANGGSGVNGGTGGSGYGLTSNGSLSEVKQHGRARSPRYVRVK